MAAIDTTYFASDLAAVIADMPCVAKFGSTTFNCAASGVTHDEALILVGNVSNDVVRIIFPITAFTVSATFKPQARLQLKFPDLTAFQNYAILSIDYTPDSVAYEVILQSDNRA